MLSGSSAFSQGAPDLIYYRFDGSGSSVPNVASSPVGKNPATLEGAMSQGGSGQFGGGLVGTGDFSNNDYVDTGWVMNLTGSWTISLHLSGIPSTSTVHYFFGDPSAGLFRCHTNGIAGAGNLILRGPFPSVLASGGATAEAKVTHFVYDASVPEFRAYVNGTRVNTVPTGAVTLSGTTPLKLGGYASDAGLPSGAVLDEFRVYQRALSTEEIALSWNRRLFGADTLGFTNLKPFTASRVGARSRPQTLLIQNLADETVGGLDAVLSGKHRRDFRIAKPAPSLGTDAVTGVKIIFQPRGEGTRRAVLSVKSEAPTKTFVLKGTSRRSR
jgi:hypothetical protein